MKKINIFESLKGVKVSCPNGTYYEEVKIGRYTVMGIFLPDGYFLYIFRGDELRAIISNEEWFIGKVDGEGQNLLNRLLAVYG